MLKRFLDLIFAGLGILIVSPIMIIIAVLAKMTSRGPVLFRQVRVGLHGLPFTIYKFRTMVVDAESMGAKISQQNDPRVTQLGHTLRITKLDELPQLFNVLKGEMSFVGPRPEVPKYVELYTDEQRQVLNVRPGIIGPAQIIGRNEEQMYDENSGDAEDFYITQIMPDKLKIDVHYAQNPSLGQDFKLLFRGISATIFGYVSPTWLQGRAGWPSLFIMDLHLIFISNFFAYSLRFDWAIPNSEMTTFLKSLPIVVGIRVLFFHLFRLYQSYYKYISIKDLIQIVKAITASTAVIVIAVFFTGLRVHSRSIFLIDWAFLMLWMAGIRVLLRLWSEKKSPKTYAPINNLLIVGAGDVGEMLVREFSKNGQQYRVVGFIDDDPDKIGSTIHGIKVYGQREDIPNVTRMLHVDEILISVSQIEPHEMRSILSYCEKAKIKHRVVPAVSDLVSGKIHLSKIREVDVSDLLGRQPLRLDLTAIEEFIANKRVLITGAGGSIGSELSLQVASHHPAELLLLDRSENYLFELENEMRENQKSNGTNIRYLIADITDAIKMEKTFSTFRPQIVFHAAAQKHVPLSESNIDEAVRNNVFGTKVLALTANRYGVDHFVQVSTDKAVNPTSVMGATKRVAEIFLQSLAEYSNTSYITVRFGNVLNSHGSVVPVFLKQIQKGGPITITDPRIERFFMSIPEAVNLILQAVTMGSSGEIYILDMGKSIRIETLAIEMIKLTGLRPHTDIKIEYTKLRPGEKLYEELVGQNEIAMATTHSMIRKIVQRHIMDFPDVHRQTEYLIKQAKDGLQEEILGTLHELLPEYQNGFDAEADGQNGKEIVRKRKAPKVAVDPEIYELLEKSEDVRKGEHKNWDVETIY
jgi:FlaA1/EpsC-like NDP-sugar epimerase/lipopolysaccharide/colanic/teichoic acid biosynthesis glycosyltransferase